MTQRSPRLSAPLVPPQADQVGTSPPTYLQADEFAASPLLARWYRFLTPSPPVNDFCHDAGIL